MLVYNCKELKNGKKQHMKSFIHKKKHTSSGKNTQYTTQYNIL